MYIVWHFIDDIAQLNGVFDKEEDAQKLVKFGIATILSKRINRIMSQ